MAVDATQQEAKSRLRAWFRRLVDFYDGVMVEMRKVTWPDRAAGPAGDDRHHHFRVGARAG